MSKKLSIILLVIISLIGSVVTFYAVNLVVSDISNLFGSVDVERVLITIPFFLVAVYFEVGALLVFKLCVYKDRKSSFLRVYSLIFGILALIGMVFTVISMLLKNQAVNDYPFKGYAIILLIIHILVLAFSVLVFIRNKEKQEDNIPKKTKIKQVLITILIGAFVFYAYDKFGAFLCAFIYAQLRTLYLTFPFYMWLLIPILLLTIFSLSRYGFFDKNPRNCVISYIVVSILNIILAVVTMIIGSQNPIVVSAISPALPLERLVTMPIGVIDHFVFSLIASVLFTIGGIRKIKNK